MKNKKKKISISIPSDLLKEIKSKSERMDISVSTCISMILKGNLKL